FPRRWRKQGQPVNVQDFSRNVLAKRPLGGSKRALKPRSFQYAADAIAAGYEPESKNPVTTVLTHIFDMQRAIFEHDLRGELGARGEMQFKRAAPGGAVIPPDGYAKVDDPRMKRFSSEYRLNPDGSRELKPDGTPYAPKVIFRGEYVVTEPAARLINHYLA